jgi:predicted nucleic acid-binding Zn ribbon protein
MALSKQIHLYGLDTSAFLFNDEKKVYKKMMFMFIHKSSIYTEIEKYEKLLKKKKIEESDKEFYEWKIHELKERRVELNKVIKKYKNKFLERLKTNSKKKRFLRNEMLTDNKIISVFESSLTRALKCDPYDVTTDLFIVKTFHYEIAESLIKNNFKFNGDDYVLYTASAGQIRLSKFVVIKKDAYDKVYNQLSCGLSVEDINKKGGSNTNKYLAYLALQNSATELWEGFDIDRSIVVDDFETMVGGYVDFIDYQTYEIKKNTYMDVPIPHMDGAGIYLPKVSKKNVMVRLPWVKGLLISTPFDKFINEYNAPTKIKDIYGKEWDIEKDDIQIIFTKSQFKMWKYYDSWEHYKDNFKKYNCQAGTCNEEVEDPKYSRVNYQFLQSLTDITDEELATISKKTVDNINNLGSDVSVMLRILGGDKSNKNKNPFQEALSIYPEMLVDEYSKKVLKDTKKSLVKEAKSGKLFIDGHYTFISPDVFAFMQWLFLGIEKPDGLLKDGEVSCSLYRKSEKLDVMRSPSLYREHAVRKNVFNSETDKWFTTTALYTSTHDLITKLLMNDVDGDAVQVVADKTFIEVAERNMKGIVPLHYDMKKAQIQEINTDSLYDGLKMAFSNQTIGLYSNSITKVWNSNDVNLDVIKLLCLESNYSIDAAKTLYFIERPMEINNLISRYTKSKPPHFFVHAKDKDEKAVEPINKHTVMGRLEKIIPSKTLRFKKTNLARFDYKMLMRDKGVIIDKELCEIYDKLNSGMYGSLSQKSDDGTFSNMNKLCYDMKIELLSIIEDEDLLVDMLVAYTYGEMKENKFFLWYVFGDKILETLKMNLAKSDISGLSYCEKCGKRIEKMSNKTKYCDECAEIMNKEVRAEINRRYYKNNKIKT